MPHMILEYSANMQERPDPKALLRRLHDTLLTIGSYNMADIKSRIIVHEDFLVSDGERDQAFAHLQLAILPREEKIRNESTEALLNVLKDVFAGSLATKNCGLSVEIRDLDRDSYRKASGGTL